MMKHRSLKYKYLNNDGFTLIELLMVVIILGILAAVVIPQFSSSSKDAKESVLKSNLSAIRGALELYALQHNEQYPQAADSDGFVGMLTQYSNKSHIYQAGKDPNFPYGPYLKHGFPKNPFAADDVAGVVYIDSNTNTIGEVGADTEINAGWIFVKETGEFIANTAEFQRY